MICIFKTPLDPHPDVPGKLIPRRPAGDCQKDCHTQVAACEHDPAVRHKKEGRFLMSQEAGEALDLTPREVVISTACVKSNGRKITIKDFPDGWSFGNGVTVGATVPIQNSDPCVLSWVSFPDSSIEAVKASYDALRQIMEG